MSLAKKILLAIAAVIALAIISATIAYKLIDDSVIEEKALEALQNTLNRDVRVDGEFTLSRSLHPTLRTTGVHIASANWDEGNPLLDAKKLEFGIALLDLLRGVVTIENIVFEDATLNIKRNTEGESNLEFSSKQPSETNNSKNSSGAPFDVIDVNIKNLTVNYSDLQNETAFVYALNNFSLNPKNKQTINISASSQFDGQPIELESEMCRIRHMLRGESCALSATIGSVPFNTNIKGSISIANRGYVDLDIETSAGNINELALIKDVSIPDTESIQLRSHLAGSFEQLSIKDLDAKVTLENTIIEATGNIQSINTLSGLDISISAAAQQPAWLDNYQQILASSYIQGFNATATVQGDKQALKVNNIDSSLKLEDTKINTSGSVVVTPALEFALDIDANGKHPAWLDELQDAIIAKEIDKFSAKARIAGKDKTFNINQLYSDITVNGSNTSAQGEINIDDDSNIEIDLTVKSKGSNLQDFDKLLKQALPKSKNYSLETLFNLEKETISLSQLTVTIDETKLQGSSKIEMKSSPPNIHAELNAETLNVEHLLATLGSSDNKSEKQKETSKENTSLFTDKPIQLDWLKSADTNIDLSIKNLLYKDATVKDIKALITAQNNIATVDISSLKYKGAHLSTKTSLDANTHTYSYNLFTENFDLGKLLSETEISDTLQGKIDASLDLSSIGKTSKQVAHNANGKLSAVMTEGSLADAPIDLLASNLLVELMPGKSQKDNTKIECLFIQFSGENGVFNSDAALLNTENIVMTTNGSIDLTSEKLNLLLVPKPKNIELFTLDANIRVAGDITDPSFSLDKGSVFKKLLKSAATVALGPAVLAIPFNNMGGNKSAKCFSEVASVTTKAVEAEQEAERLALEQAEKERLEKELLEKELLEKEAN